MTFFIGPSGIIRKRHRRLDGSDIYEKMWWIYGLHSFNGCCLFSQQQDISRLVFDFFRHVLGDLRGDILELNEID